MADCPYDMVILCRDIRILIEIRAHREEHRFMDGMKNAVFTDKSIRLLGKNQYTSNIESGSTRTEIKHWVELFFGVKVVYVDFVYYGVLFSFMT